MFFRPILQIFSIFLQRCLPTLQKRRFGAILRAKQTRFSVGWDGRLLTEQCTMQNAQCKINHTAADRERRKKKSFSILYFEFSIIHNILCFVENLTTTRQKNLEKSAFCGNFYLTFLDKVVYNITLSGCMCGFAHVYSTTLIDRKGELQNVPYLPAQEASSQDGARFPQENGYCQRPQGSGS